MELKYKDYVLTKDDKSLLLKLCDCCPRVDCCYICDVLRNDSIVENFEFCFTHRQCLKIAYKKYKKGQKKK